MYCVKIYKNNKLCISAPFSERESAIRYFNLKLDSYIAGFKSFDRIEICNDNTILFDYEV